ncbi:aldose 1-epimerase family protein [Herbiconiux moechotypicola]|uniref:Aldose 1-epimerase family protein n=1 Tax=Herbiconiux moechotypicola TaxID=637393 RepID=A0ABP5Q9N7_9MICO|nr:aldose 1-epimerase family protein [Herbiconiux moechotypicola]MCS5728810.1 aldose 1-epimerase family protein [Herbiconiux moechotypicola]
MADIFGTALPEALPRIGSLEQVARVDRFVEDDGPARGARRFRVVNGGGLEFDVHPDRGLDIGAASYNGVPLAWISSTGITRPDAYEPEGRGWLRTFGGGLVTTCGLDSFGPPADDEAGVVGMHGRIGSIPARVGEVTATPEIVAVGGQVRQTAVFHENLVLTRRIWSEVGSNSFTIDDTVTNEGENPSPHMVLYHVNLGWPLLEAGTTVDIPARSVVPRDPDAVEGFEERTRIGEPTVGFREQVYIHEAGDERVARVVNPTRGMALTLRYSDTLPAVFQWKLTATKHFVLGLEPANTPEIQGRAAARENGRLPELQPGESRSYSIQIEVTA